MTNMKRKRTFVGALVLVALVAAIVSFVPKADDEPAVASRPSSRLIAAVRPAAVRAAPVRPKPGREAVDPEPPEAKQDPVFEVGGKKFRSLQEAVDAAESGGTITLTGDAYVRNPVAVRKDLRFNLNGYRLTAKNTKIPRILRQRGDFGVGGHVISVRGGHNVVVENGGIDIVSNGGKNGFTGAVEQVADSSPTAAAESVSEPAAEPERAVEHPEDAQYDVVVRDVEVTTDVTRESAFLNADGKMLIDGCTVQSDGGNGSYTIGAESSTTIRDSSFTTTAETGWGEWWNNTVAVAFDGTTVIESGTYVTQKAEGSEAQAYGTYVYSSGGTIEVRDGEFHADQVVRADKDVTRYGEDFGVSEVVVKDGALSGQLVSVQTGAEDGAEPVSGVSAYGGVYDNAPKAEQLPEGKTVVDYGDGTYSVENVALAQEHRQSEVMP